MCWPAASGCGAHRSDRFRLDTLKKLRFSHQEPNMPLYFDIEVKQHAHIVQELRNRYRNSIFYIIWDGD